MTARINRIFIDPTDKSGPKKWCELCNRYYQWAGGAWICTKCGKQADPIEHSKKVLKASKLEPFVGHKEIHPKKTRSDDLPEGGKWQWEREYSQDGSSTELV